MNTNRIISAVLGVLTTLGLLMLGTGLYQLGKSQGCVATITSLLVQGGSNQSDIDVQKLNEYCKELQ